MRTIFKLTTLLLFIVGINVHAQKKASLGLNLETGKTYYQSSVSNIEMKQNINGQEVNITMDTDTKTAFQILNEKEGVYQIKVTYPFLEVGMYVGPNLQSFSSAQNEDPFSKILSAMSHYSFELSLSKKGKITDIRGLDDYWKKIDEETKDIPAMQKSQILNQIKQSYGEKQLKTNMEMLTNIFPEEAVKKGSTWSKSSQYTISFTANIKRTFTVDRLSKTEIIINEVNHIATDNTKEEYQEINGMQMRYEMEGDNEATYTIDRTTGWIKNVNSTMKLDGFTHINAGGQVMKVPLEFTTITSTNDNGLVK
ncbi:DUF6263 family protein [Flammeovirga sp. SubArs3]|uniref:DUF6263 family protein n=1 Tax=Flammeovirga sp. SubArs3 TaxID=2995316 RepID=UPI00248BB306|nr:DUF6263 family protein [Flammeovirga sp. SubArs3]